MVDRVCVVVGVGAGLGLAIAKRFGREGYRIGMVARRIEALQNYETMLADANIQAFGFSADVGDEISLTQAFSQIHARLGVPTVLVYNAAVMNESDPLTISAETVVQEFKVSVVGALTSIQQVAGGMKAAGGGTILLTGGGLALDGFSPPQYLPLAIGKVSIRKLCFTMANALEPDNIHVATVTVCGTIEPGTHFDPDTLAEVYWQLHEEERSAWQREVVYQ
ncbi:SDR family NAD(P)-dependent oxidoreductase [Microseira wollei]|uniref:Short-chain dehydrogenase/reductase SDR n=1 Tax=Microseira wollei NIES-4236 TaxID=2530354 RepID=A0AAV3XC51_9CYAN|nr:SDR family NAD(P)-dependent oxidoreductase [Microseira wollei]GET37645.1 short-chain dehydrogenase/reductase SDR [Microseira wollei NIES-4236]